MKVNFSALMIPAISTFLAGNACAHQGSVAKPNILLINIDDLGWKDLGFMGSNFYETPNIDALSTRGMIFTNSYSCAANCAPSRACLMTGHYTPRHGIYTVGTSERGDSKDRKLIPVANIEYLIDGDLTLAEILKSHGYRTCNVGKWHIGEDPKEQGFDVNIGGANYGNPSSYFSPYKNKFLSDGPKGEYLTDRLVNEAINFIKNNKEKPFFINFATYAVHTPLQAKEEIVQKYKNKSPGSGQKNAVYAAMIESMDQSIGKLIKCLEDEGKFKNTFIIFSSDNGGVYNISRQWPLRAGKGSYYEGGIRVPTFMIWEGIIKEKSYNEIPVSNIDFLPTLLQVAGIRTPKNFNPDGKSLVPILTGKINHLNRPLFWHFPVYLEDGNEQTRDILFRTRPGSVIRLGDWKLHEYFEDGGRELYNLREDIGEQKNLLNQYPEKARKMQKILDKWRRKLNAPIPDRLNPEYHLNQKVS